MMLETILEMRIPTYYSTEHEINQFVDDSTSIVGSDTEEELGRYTTDFLKVMENSTMQINGN